MGNEPDLKEQRIRKITLLYYSRPEIQKAIFDFSRNREAVPRYFEGFGKRPDSFQYESDILGLVRKGATSFHCSEELWKNPLEIETGMSAEQLNSLRTGWDLIIDIDCKYFEVSKKAAQAVVSSLKKHGIRNLGIKFSGSKGFHILVPWASFPKDVGMGTKDLFPELPRKMLAFIKSESEKELRRILPDEFYKDFEKTSIQKGIKCNTCHSIASEKILAKYSCEFCGTSETKELSSEPKELKCPNCGREFELSKETFYYCDNCRISSLESPYNFSASEDYDLFELMGLDFVLVSPRHLFRMPYSLHEKTALASVVITEDEIENFQLKDANPLTAVPRNFLPEAREGEAKEFATRALEWYAENVREEKPYSERKASEKFSPVKIENFSDKNFPPSVQKILLGLKDGKKRALFILLNFFRSLNLESGEIERRLYEWNAKNDPPLKEGYIYTQILWSMKKPPVMPPSFDKDYYKGIGIIPTEEEIRLKNPVTYMVSKSQKAGQRSYPKKSPGNGKAAKKKNSGKSSRG